MAGVGIGWAHGRCSNLISFNLAASAEKKTDEALGSCCQSCRRTILSCLSVVLGRIPVSPNFIECDRGNNTANPETPISLKEGIYLKLQ